MLLWEHLQSAVQAMYIFLGRIFLSLCLVNWSPNGMTHEGKKWPSCVRVSLWCPKPFIAVRVETNLCNNCWNLSNDLKKQNIFLLTDKLSQANTAASSDLRENVYPVIFIAKMLVYIIFFYNYYIVILLA